jgi:hypothetical protein
MLWVVGECVPEGHGAHLVETAHHELPQPTITRLRIGAFRSRGALAGDRLGLMGLPTLAPGGNRRGS